MTITKLLTTAIHRLNDWRQAALFITPEEGRLMLGVATDLARSDYQKTTEAQVAKIVEEAEELKRKAKSLWADMQQLKMEVNGRRQFVQITLLLDRKTLALLDVTDAARLIAGRTERIYCEKIKEALKKAQ